MEPKTPEPCMACGTTAVGTGRNNAKWYGGPKDVCDGCFNEFKGGQAMRLPVACTLCKTLGGGGRSGCIPERLNASRYGGGPNYCRKCADHVRHTTRHRAEAAYANKGERDRLALNSSEDRKLAVEAEKKAIQQEIVTVLTQSGGIYEPEDHARYCPPADELPVEERRRIEVQAIRKAWRYRQRTGNSTPLHRAVYAEKRGREW